MATTAQISALSVKVLQQQALASTRCPKLVSRYAFLAESVAYALNRSSFTSFDDLVETLADLDAECAKANVPPIVVGPAMYVTAGSGNSRVPWWLWVAGGVGLYLMFRKKR